MPAKMVVTLKKLKMPIAGLGKIDICLDGSPILSMSLGESAVAEVAAGRHVVMAILDGVFKRRSKQLEIFIEENSTAKIDGKYSRIWGNMKLHQS